MISTQKLEICPVSVQSARDVNVLRICDELGIRYEQESYHEYHLVDHHSLKIHPVKGWYWFSQEIGGNAIDFLIKYVGYQFTDAMKFLLRLAGRLEEFITGMIPLKRKSLPDNYFPMIPGGIKLPPFSRKWDRSVNYLIDKRGIDRQIVTDAMADVKLYEDAKHHNCVFVAYDDYGTPKSASLRSTGRKVFKGDLKGSIKRYAFTLGRSAAHTIHVFESAIDAMSYMTIAKLSDLPLDDLYLSLDGSAVKPLDNWLQRHPEADTIIIHTDNDDAGEKAAETIRNSFKDKRRIIDARPKDLKDCNEVLLSLRSENGNAREFLSKCFNWKEF